ncbi:LEF-5 [Carcinus maenas nudivirus]|uniref:LEF-5 n=1 Tax=Carcinus maenas nudivirus TaxID=2880837 RepID=A0AAE8Y3F7_9VIRU|nr:LEF-5 [Carcinus maenas nudivirus]UBZ25628.1 LEF-5 [Carcinus maenas nudivirus]
MDYDKYINSKEEEIEDDLFDDELLKKEPDEYDEDEDEDDEEDDDDEDSMDISDIDDNVSTSTTPKQKNSKKKEIISIDKLNVIHTPSESVGLNIELSDTMMIVAFTNIAISVPKIALSDVSTYLKPCPPIDSSAVYKCEHIYDKRNEKTRSGDEAFTVIYTCQKCHHVKYSN